MILENEKNDPIELERKLLLLGNISEMFTTGLFIINAFLKKIEFNHKIIHVVVNDFPHKYPNINIEKDELKGRIDESGDLPIP